MDTESGRIIYSVGKQADFAATVTKGALANSAIGQVIKPLVDSKNSKALIVQDFSAYASAYNDQVVFLALALDKMLAQFRGSIHGVSDASTSDCWISGRTGCSRGHFGAKHSNRAGKYCSAANAVAQMVDTVKEVAENASSTADAALHADHAASDGREVVAKAIDSIKQVAQQVVEAGNVIQKLEQDSQKIGSVLGVIEGIAEQTNLLALNAAIEAARAGEQGRGFAVVADEVRSLANRTYVSTREIETMIQALQSGSKQAVEVMEKSVNQTQTTVERANKVGVTLNSIVASVDTITAMSQQIATATQQQNEVAGKLDVSISNIKDQATNTLQHACKISTSSDELAESAIQLDQLVARFKV